MRVAFLIFLGGLQVIAATLVDTIYGPVEGVTITLEDDNFHGTEIDTYLGVPFAKPPVGERRFLPPEEPDPWEDVFMADSLRSVCIQASTHPRSHPDWDDYSEDCLHMNIYAPRNDSGVPYPVMMYIHGGSYQTGANILTPGHFLAANGVVAVSINYRLGIFGFAYSGDDMASGNMGMYDQLMALQFVQYNIAAFGGDPNKVTIFGESAGASSVGLLLMSPLSEGLFHHAIMESGSEFALWAYMGPHHDPVRYLQQVAENMECPTENPDMVQCLREIPPEYLHGNSSFECVPGADCLGFQPIVDGPGGFLPDVIQNIRESEEFHKVPLIAGIQQEDNAYFMRDTDLFINGTTREQFRLALWAVALFYQPGFPNNETADRMVEALDFVYAPWPHIHDLDLNRHQAIMAGTDLGFGAPCDMTVKAHHSYAPTYYYINGHSPVNPYFPEWLGTAHMAELPFVFGMPFLQDNPDIMDQMQATESAIDWEQEDKEFSLFMMRLWTNFAKEGNPTPQPVDLPPSLGGGEIWWEAFAGDAHNYIHFGNDTVVMSENYRSLEYAFWQDYWQWLISGDDGLLPE